MENKLRIEYTIVSRGTEKYGSKGYMGVSQSKNGKRYFVLSNHHEKYIKSYNDSFCFDDFYNIENITLSRFELISKLALKDKGEFINDNIIICGFGNIGFATLIYLLDRGYKNIDILVKKNTIRFKNVINQFNIQYNSNLKLVNEVLTYNTYIEATGKSNIIKDIFDNIEVNASVFLLGTPRDKEYLIDPLEIHRKNIKIFGGHELNGHCFDERNQMFIGLLEKNKDKNLDDFVNIYDEEPNVVNSVLEKKCNFFEVIKYDI